MTEIIVAVITGGIALSGTVITVILSNNSVKKLMEYRVEQLEKTVRQFGNFSDRILTLEKDVAQILRELKKTWEKIDRIKEDTENAK